MVMLHGGRGVVPAGEVDTQGRLTADQLKGDLCAEIWNLDTSVPSPLALCVCKALGLLEGCYGY